MSSIKGGFWFYSSNVPNFFLKGPPAKNKTNIRIGAYLDLSVLYKILLVSVQKVKSAKKKIRAFSSIFVGPLQKPVWASWG